MRLKDHLGGSSTLCLNVAAECLKDEIVELRIVTIGFEKSQRILDYVCITGWMLELTHVLFILSIPISQSVHVLALLGEQYPFLQLA